MGPIGTHWGNFGVILGLYWNNGKENGKENGNYYLGLGSVHRDCKGLYKGIQAYRLTCIGLQGYRRVCRFFGGVKG